MSTLLNAEKGESTIHAYLIATSPGMVWASEVTVNLCIEHHLQGREKNDAGKFVSTYHPRDGSPAFVIVSDEELSMVTIVTMSEMQEFADLGH